MLFTTRTTRVALALASAAGERHDVIEIPSLDVKAGVELFCSQFYPGKMDPSSKQSSWPSDVYLLRFRMLLGP
jgi:hypothetical protein